MIAIDPTNVRAMRATAFRPIHLTGPAYGSRGLADDQGIAAYCAYRPRSRHQASAKQGLPDSDLERAFEELVRYREAGEDV
jgi:hypothetical protein